MLSAFNLEGSNLRCEWSDRTLPTFSVEVERKWIRNYSSNRPSASGFDEIGVDKYA
jgi:hypothetical protein